jgi:hypothetical protein
MRLPGIKACLLCHNLYRPFAWWCWEHNFWSSMWILADSSCHAVLGMGLWLLAYWDSQFESCQGLGSLSVFELCVLSGSGLCPGLMNHSGESYQMRCVWM